MLDRGVNVNSSDFKHPLDSIYYKPSKQSNSETGNQYKGRVCSTDTIPKKRMIYGPPDALAAHEAEYKLFRRSKSVIQQLDVLRGELDDGKGAQTPRDIETERAAKRVCREEEEAATAATVYKQIV